SAHCCTGTARTERRVEMTTAVETRVIRTAARSKRASNRRALLLGLQIGVPVLLLAAWWFGSLNSTNPYFPPLRDILAQFQNLWLFDKFLSDIVPSIGNFTIGYLIAVVAGVLVGILLGLVKQLF